MKNIIIIGRPRAGKSTLADMICNKYNYQVIRTDCIRNAFKEVFPELNIRPGTAINDIRFQKYVKKFLSMNIYQSRGAYGFVLEGCEITPEMCKNLYGNNNENLIYALGRCNETVEEMTEALLKYDTEYDWTFKKSKEELLEYSEKQIIKSKELKEECQKYNVKFYDTSFDRKKVLNEVMKDIEENIKYNT